MRRSHRPEIGSLSTCDPCKNCIADTKNTRDAPKGASRCSFSANSSSRLLQPVLELVHGDDFPATFLFHLSGLLAPGVELLVGDAAGLDSGKALLVLLAVGLEHRIVGLLLGPLLEGPASRQVCWPEATGRSQYSALTRSVLGNHRPQFLHRRTVIPRSTQLRRE